MQSACDTALLSAATWPQTAAETVAVRSWTDANGNVCDLIDTTGSTVAHYEYSPFGSLVASTGEFASANPWQFSSKYYDEETQLKYYGYRYLENGRWISRDPVGEKGAILFRRSEYTLLESHRILGARKIQDVRALLVHHKVVRDIVLVGRLLQYLEMLESSQHQADLDMIQMGNTLFLNNDPIAHYDILGLEMGPNPSEWCVFSSPPSCDGECPLCAECSIQSMWNRAGGLTMWCACTYWN